MDQLCEHSFESFQTLTDEIMSLGYDEETASHYAALIGDIYIMDGEGNTLVIDHRNPGVVIARLKLKRDIEPTPLLDEMYRIANMPMCDEAKLLVQMAIKAQKTGKMPELPK